MRACRAPVGTGGWAARTNMRHMLVVVTEVTCGVAMGFDSNRHPEYQSMLSPPSAAPRATHYHPHPHPHTLTHTQMRERKRDGGKAYESGDEA